MRRLTERRKGLAVVNVARVADVDDYGREMVYGRDKRYKGGKVVEGQKLKREWAWEDLASEDEGQLFDSEDERSADSLDEGMPLDSNDDGESMDDWSD